MSLPRLTCVLSQAVIDNSTNRYLRRRQRWRRQAQSRGICIHPSSFQSGVPLSIDSRHPPCGGPRFCTTDFPFDTARASPATQWVDSPDECKLQSSKSVDRGFSKASHRCPSGLDRDSCFWDARQQSRARADSPRRGFFRRGAVGCAHGRTQRYSASRATPGHAAEDAVARVLSDRVPSRSARQNDEQRRVPRPWCRCTCRGSALGGLRHTYTAEVIDTNPAAAGSIQRQYHPPREA